MDCQLIRLYEEKERLWFSQRPSIDFDSWQSMGLDSSHLLCYGEIGFMLLGLKPAVIICYLNDAQLNDYVDNVIISSGLLKNEDLDMARILNVSTKFYDFDQHYILYNKSHNKYDLVQKIFLADMRDKVSELEMALVLDYPVHLNENIDTTIDPLMEVAYVDQEKNTLLTSYGAYKSQLDNMVQSHFNHYKRKCQSIWHLGIDIKPV